jgi:hypothetical protein
MWAVGSVAHGSLARSAIRRAGHPLTAGHFVVLGNL